MYCMGYLLMFTGCGERKQSIQKVDRLRTNNHRCRSSLLSMRSGVLLLRKTVNYEESPAFGALCNRKNEGEGRGSLSLPSLRLACHLATTAFEKAERFPVVIFIRYIAVGTAPCSLIVSVCRPLPRSAAGCRYTSFPEAVKTSQLTI